MNLNYKRIIINAFVIFFITLTLGMSAHLVKAQGADENPDPVTGVDGGNPDGGLTGVDGGNPDGGMTGVDGGNPDGGLTGVDGPKLSNPLKAGYNNLCDLINAFVNIVAEIGGILAVIFIIWSGFLFIKAQGNEKELETAKNAFKTTIIGTAILLGATVITKVIVNTVESVTSSATGTSTSICEIVKPNDFA